jgi:hypothetical protein
MNLFYIYCLLEYDVLDSNVLEEPVVSIFSRLVHNTILHGFRSHKVIIFVVGVHM